MIKIGSVLNQASINPHFDSLILPAEGSRLPRVVFSPTAYLRDVQVLK